MIIKKNVQNKSDVLVLTLCFIQTTTTKILPDIVIAINQTSSIWKVSRVAAVDVKAHVFESMNVFRTADVFSTGSFPYGQLKSLFQIADIFSLTVPRYYIPALQTRVIDPEKGCFHPISFVQRGGFIITHRLLT